MRQMYVPWTCTMIAAVVASAPVLDTIPTVHSMSMSSNSTISLPRADPDNIGFGEKRIARAIYSMVSLLCICLLAGMVGYRIRMTDRHQLQRLNLAHGLIYLLYLFSISFVLSAAVVVTGLGLSTISVCRGAINLCLAFYITSKIIMYLFLVERAHTLRAPYVRRIHDWMWVSGTLVIAIVFGTIAIIGFKFPVVGISSLDGRCRIGLHRFTTVPLVVADVLINILLTSVFVYLLSPLVRSGVPAQSAFPASRLTKCLRGICSRRETGDNMDLQPANQTRARKIEKLLWRTFIGSCLVLVPTVGNMVSLTALNGKELGWICLTVCTLDITWTVCVFHWLTIGSSDGDERASAELVPDTPSTSNLSGELLPASHLRC